MFLLADKQLILKKFGQITDQSKIMILIIGQCCLGLCVFSIFYKQSVNYNIVIYWYSDNILYLPKYLLYMRILKEIDSQPYSIQLNYKNKFDSKSHTGGFITLIFYIAAAVVLGLNGYFFIMQSQYIFSQEQIKNDLGLIELNSQWFGLLLTGTNSKDEAFNITKDNQELYGLKVYVEHVTNINGSDIPTIEAAAGFKTQIFDFRNFFMFPQNFDMSMSGRSDVIIQNMPYNRFGMIVKNISKPGTQYRQIVNLTAKLIFVNNVTSPKSINSIVGKKVRIFYIRDGIPLIQDELQQLTLYFRKLYVVTDTDKVFSNQLQFNSTFFDEESLAAVISDNQYNDNWLIQIKFKRSLYTLRYNRHFKKIAAYLGQSFGVIGLISLVFIVYRGYNKWCFTENELIPKNYRQKTNIFKFYKHQIQKLKKITTANSSTIQQFQHKMDIQKILQRLDDFEDRIRALEGRSFMHYSEDQQPQHAIPIKKSENHNLNNSDQKQYQNKERLLGHGLKYS